MGKPNLLFIYTDEQAAGTMAAYGNGSIDMPHLDGLALSCTVFEQAYVTQPVCTPSRSTLLTGQWPHTNGCTENNIPLPAQTLCMPQMLNDEDCVTAHFGKWHLGDEIFAQRGFEHWCSIDDGYRGYYSEGRSRDPRSDYHHFLKSHGFEPRNRKVFGRAEIARYPEDFSKPAFLASRVRQFLVDHRSDRFLLFVNFFEPHMPYFGPRDDQYSPGDVVLPPNYSNPPTAEQPLKARAYREAYYENGHSGLPLQSEADWRRLIANYWGLCSLVDTYVGEILDTLGELGIYDDTIIVYTSDHGDMMGSHQLTAKCVMFEEAIRVPLLLKAPGQIAGKRVSGPVSQIDLAPTLLELLGCSAHEQCQGASLAPLVTDQRDASSGREVVVEWQGPNSGVLWEGEGGAPAVPASMRGMCDSEELARHILDPVRTIISPGGWKFSLSTLGEHELYDVREDPGETTNLAARGGYEEHVALLADRIRDWQVRTRDPAAADPGFADPRER